MADGGLPQTPHGRNEPNVKVRALLAAGAATAALVGTGIGTAAASASTAPAATQYKPVFAGVVRPADAHFASPTAAVACREPNCKLSYRGGAVQHHPHVYLVFWGKKWNTKSPAYRLLTGFFRGVGTSQDHWSRTMTQYHDRHGRPSFRGSVLSRTVIDHRAPGTIHFSQFQAEANKIYRQLRIHDKIDTQIVIVGQHGQCYNAATMGGNFAGNCGRRQNNAQFCAWHTMTSSGIPVVNLPYQLDAGTLCGKNWVNGGFRGMFDGFSTVGGHEYAETVTDPNPPSGWFDPRDSISGGEIADKCAWGGAPFGVHDPKGDLHLHGAVFAVQSLWSNAADGCRM